MTWFLAWHNPSIYPSLVEVAKIRSKFGLKLEACKFRVEDFQLAENLGMRWSFLFEEEEGGSIWILWECSRDV